jgi:hypothetical protein
LLSAAALDDISSDLLEACAPRARQLLALSIFKMTHDQNGERGIDKPTEQELGCRKMTRVAQRRRCSKK